MSARVERVSTPDGPFDLTVWLPEAGHGPGILLIQEIYGVGDYIRAVAEDLAALGYVVAAPDLFWRIKPGYQARHDEQGLTESLDVSSRFDAERGVDDAELALRHLAALPEVQGGLGVVGFCLGGSIAYFLAARAPADAVVSFYGSAVPDHTDALALISAPIQFHFGGSDPYIPRAAVARVQDAVRGHENAEIHVEEDAGHAFHNRKAPMFHQPGPAARAWRRTEDFLARHLPVHVQLPELKTFERAGRAPLVDGGEAGAESVGVPAARERARRLALIVEWPPQSCGSRSNSLAAGGVDHQDRTAGRGGSDAHHRCTPRQGHAGCHRHPGHEGEAPPGGARRIRDRRRRGLGERQLGRRDRQ